MKGLAYDHADEEYRIHLDFGSPKVEFMTLEQNEPNPFRGETNIGFFIPEDDLVRFDFYDVTGRLLHTVERRYTAGDHVIRLSQNELKAEGVIRYRLTYQGTSLSKTMVMIR